jgi:CheY-like chemotaxis protein
VGFQVRVAEDGSQAVELFQEWQPQFIWMDLSMPVMNGFEATRNIRTRESRRSVKIAALTASGSEADRAVALAEGFDDFVFKPYRLNDIFGCMERHLSVRFIRTEDPPAACEQPAVAFQAEDWDGVPEGLRLKLRDAVMSLEVGRISAVIDRIAESHPVLGAYLKQQAGKFAFTSILHAIDHTAHVDTRTDLRRAH